MLRVVGPIRSDVVHRMGSIKKTRNQIAQKRPLQLSFNSNSIPQPQFTSANSDHSHANYRARRVTTG